MNSLYQTLSRINQIQSNLSSLSSKNTLANVKAIPKDNRDTNTPTASLTSPSLNHKNFLNQLQNNIFNLASDSATDSAPPYDAIINTAAEKYSLPESLIKSVIAVESNFNRQAVSPKGAMGLMQLMPTTAEQYNVKEPYSPEENILAGTAHLRKLLDRNDNNLIRALAAYNAGERALSEESVPNYQETQNYIKRVLDHYMRNNGVKL